MIPLGYTASFLRGNEHTYYSFRDFAHSLITMGMIPEVALEAKRGTILMDRHKIFAPEPHPNPDLIDAWLRPHTSPKDSGADSGPTGGPLPPRGGRPRPG